MMMDRFCRGIFPDDGDVSFCWDVLNENTYTYTVEKFVDHIQPDNFIITFFKEWFNFIDVTINFRLEFSTFYFFFISFCCNVVFSS